MAHTYYCDKNFVEFDFFNSVRYPYPQEGSGRIDRIHNVRKYLLKQLLSITCIEETDNNFFLAQVT